MIPSFYLQIMSLPSCPSIIPRPPAYPHAILLTHMSSYLPTHHPVYLHAILLTPKSSYLPPCHPARSCISVPTLCILTAHPWNLCTFPRLPAYIGGISISRSYCFLAHFFCSTQSPLSIYLFFFIQHPSPFIRILNIHPHIPSHFFSSPFEDTHSLSLRTLYTLFTSTPSLCKLVLPPKVLLSWPWDFHILTPDHIASWWL